MPPRPLVSTAEVARALGLSPRTIQNYRKSGLLVPDVESPGGHARWDLEKVSKTLRDLAADRKAAEARRNGTDTDTDTD